MLSKILKYTILSFAAYLWLQAYSPLVYKWSRLFPDDYRNGDLYHLSYLPQFKEELPICHTPKSVNPFKNVNLFVIGDSFTEEQRVNKKDLNSFKYLNVHWEKHTEIQLDTTKINILILETVERTFKNHFSSEVNNFSFKENEVQLKIKKTWRKILKEKAAEFVSFVFPDKDGIEQRFEASLFSYDFFLKFREIKSSINLDFFGRVEKKVVVSKDEKKIFFSEESLPTDSHSAFYPFSDEEKDKLVTNINSTQKKYLEAGFNKVYLSIIPNKVSILEPNLGNYNHLIERIQNDSNLKVPFIDTYSDFKKNPSRYYLKSDSHWTCEGRDIWLEKVNKILLNP